MAEFSMECEPLEEVVSGKIVAVTYHGVYPIGAEGNPTARRMVTFLEQVLSEQHPVGVVIDCVDLDYQWGDAIGELAIVLLRAGVPGAMVAVNRTATALHPLFARTMIFGVTGMELFSTRAHALAYVTSRVSPQGHAGPETA